MRRAVLALALSAGVAACGGSDATRDRVDDATQELRSGGREGIDRAEEALKQLEHSDLPEDARRELEEAKRLLEEAKN